MSDSNKKGDFQLPKDWHISKIQEFSEVLTGGTPSTKNKDYWNGSIPWMASGDIHQRFIYDVEGRISEFGLENSNCKIIPVNSVLIALNGQGKTRATVALLKKKMTCNQSIAAIIPSESHHPKYLYYNLANRYSELRNITGSNSRTGLNLKIIRNILVPLPPFPEQRRIAIILSNVDEAIQKTQQIIDQTQQVKQGLMQTLFTKGIGHTRFKDSPLGEIPEEWNAKRLSDIVPTDYPITYGIVQAGPHIPGGVPYIRSTDLSKTRINLNALLCTSCIIANKYKRSEVVPGDIIFSLRGNVGEVLIVPPELPRANLTQGTARIRCKSNIDNEFIYNAIQSPIIKNNIQKTIKGSTFREITLKDLRNIQVPVPSYVEQKKISSIIQKVISSENISLKHLYQFEKGKKGLMQQLLTGKVRVKVDT